MEEKRKIWIVSFCKYIKEHNIIYGPYSDLFNSEEKASNRVKELRDDGWFAEKSYNDIVMY